MHRYTRNVPQKKCTLCEKSRSICLKQKQNHNLNSNVWLIQLSDKRELKLMALQCKSAKKKFFSFSKQYWYPLRSFSHFVWPTFCFVITEEMIFDHCWVEEAARRWRCKALWNISWLFIDPNFLTDPLFLLFHFPTDLTFLLIPLFRLILRSDWFCTSNLSAMIILFSRFSYRAAHHGPKVNFCGYDALDHDTPFHCCIG